jgi:hypothetical protein
VVSIDLSVCGPQRLSTAISVAFDLSPNSRARAKAWQRLSELDLSHFNGIYLMLQVTA